MPQNNPLGYLPLDVQLALLGSAPLQGGLGMPGAGLGQTLALTLDGAAPAPQRVTARPVVPQFTERDAALISQMDYQTLMRTRKQLQQRGFLSPEVDTHFSRRLQTINTKR